MGMRSYAPCPERALLVDADDTLWENNVFYLSCRAHFQAWMQAQGYEPEITAAMLDRCEMEAVASYGYGPEGYVEALGWTCERLLRQRGRSPEPDLLAKARSFGELVLSPPMVLIAGVEETLRALKPTSRLILVTKGSEAVQRDKIARSGLGHLFEAHYIVGEKDAPTYRRIAAERDLELSCTWVVGNSPKSDINPAIEAGMGVIWVPHERTWKAELQELKRPELVVTLRRFSDLLPFFGIEIVE